MRNQASVTKEINKINEDLKDITDCIKKGWNTYLGDNIFARKRDLKEYLSILYKERESLKKKHNGKVKRTIHNRRKKASNIEKYKGYSCI